jgi:hypothetical protein
MDFTEVFNTDQLSVISYHFPEWLFANPLLFSAHLGISAVKSWRGG